MKKDKTNTNVQMKVELAAKAKSLLRIGSHPIHSFFMSIIFSDRWISHFFHKLFVVKNHIKSCP